MRLELITYLALTGAAMCWIALAAPELPGVVRRIRGAARTAFRLDQVRVDLIQAELGSLPPAGWIGLRLLLAAIAGLLGYLLFGLLVIALVAALAVYHLLGLALEARRRQAEARRQRALLDSIRFGISVMSRAGGAVQMLQALATSGPIDAQPIFRELVAEIGAPAKPASWGGEIGSGSSGDSGGGELLAPLQRMRQRLADPLFDDIALALTLHWRRGGKLIPALEALADEWNQALSLQREAKALRAGIEATVLLLSVLPFGFLFLIHMLAPGMLHPFATPGGEILLAAAAAWMVLGYRILQRMSEAPREERVQLGEIGVAGAQARQ